MLDQIFDRVIEKGQRNRPEWAPIQELLRQQQWRQALDTINKTLKGPIMDGPFIVGLYARRARCLYKLGQVEAAYEDIRHVNTRPNRPPAIPDWKFQLLIEMELGQERPRAHNRLQIDPDHPLVGWFFLVLRICQEMGRFNFGALMEEFGNYLYAQPDEAYKELVIAEPDTDEGAAWVEYGKNLQSIGLVEEAEAVYREAFTRDPKHPPAYLQLAFLLHQSDQVQKALVIYQQLTHRFPSEATYWQYYAVALLETQSFEQGHQIISQGLNLDPVNGDLWSLRGSCFHQQGQAEEAIRCFQRAVDHDSSLFATWYQWAYLAWKQGKYAEATAAFQEVIIRYPVQETSLRVWKDIGEKLVELGVYTSSRQVFRALAQREEMRRFYQE